MAITVVQAAQATTFPWSFSSAVTAGNTVIVAVDCVATGPQPLLAAPTLGGSAVTGAYPIWNDIVSSNSSNGIWLNSSAVVSAWVLPNCPAANGINFGTNNTNTNVGNFAYEVSGLGPAPVVNVSTKNSNVGTTALSSGTTPNTTQAPAFILGAMASYGGTATAPSGGFTSTHINNNGWAGYQIATTSGSNYTWTQTTASGGFSAGVAAITASGGGGGPTNTGGMFFGA